LNRTVSRVLIGGRRGATVADLPVIEWRSPRPGPNVVVTANLHGDEAVGVAAVHRLDQWLGTVDFAGTVSLYPSCNPLGLASQTRLVPGDDVDLNRSFPGSPRGAYAARLAAALWRDLCARRPDVVIDLHADSPLSIPYVIIDRPVRHVAGGRRELAARVARLAEATGLTVLREYPDDLYIQLGLDRSLAGAVVNLLGAPALTIEAGPRRYVSLESVEVAVDAVRGVLGAMSVVDEPVRVHSSRVPGVWRRAGSARTRKAGVLRPELKPGEVFYRGDRVASLLSLTGVVEEEVTAVATGIVVSWVELAWVAAGGVIGTLGVVEEDG
jgi:predicted deacylase